MSKLQAAICGALLLTACASTGSTPSTTYDTRPTAATPRIAFLWHEQLTSWEFLSTEPKEFANPTHIGSSDELVVATSEGEVLKMQASNGKVLWRNRLDGVFHAGATTGSGRAYLADLEGNVIALELNSGAVAWRTSLPNSIETRGAYSQGRLFLSDAADMLHAFDAATGEEIWTYARDVPEYFTVKGSCTPVVDGDAVYCGFSDGSLVALQVDSGERIWEVDLADGVKNFADVDGAVKVVGNRIYAVSYAGGVYALQRDTGAPIWHARVDSAADFVVSQDRIFVASAIGRVVALSLEDGEPLWGFKMKDSLPGSLTTFGPYVMAFATDGPLYVLDAESGYVHVKWTGTSGFGASVERGSSRLYALTNHGQLFGLKLGY